jgi:hypothetical protein
MVSSAYHLIEIILSVVVAPSREPEPTAREVPDKFGTSRFFPPLEKIDSYPVVGSNWSSYHPGSSQRI